ncbi:MAG TPA: ParB/RepB/Spo0J family partition protein [Bryobacteraceae bacterium]|jgi:ParB family chromosome partitioning protein|nr:ParB/RepB/Spo0J family partition protein [Bryobacteraceae bacterium]
MNKPELERSQRKALGKGLSALLPGKNGMAARGQGASAGVSDDRSPLPSSRSPLPENFERFESISTDRILAGEEQPRNSFDAEKMEELARSIRVHGILQPITVVRAEEGKFRIVAGERRWRAAKLAGLKEVPTLVRTVPDHKRLELALIENIQREDLNPIETASAFARLISDHKLSHEQVAERTGKERSTVTNFLRLLKLAPEIQEQLIAGNITMGHARTLLSLPDAAAQREAARRVVTRKLSVRETEALVKQLLEPPRERAEKKEHPAPPIDPNVRAALDELQSALGTKVRLVAKSPSSGKLEIEYHSQDDLDRIYSVIVR